MTRSWVRGSAALGALLAAAGMALTLQAAPQDATAQREPNGRGGARAGRRAGGMMPGRMRANRLGLTDAQKQQMKSIAESRRGDQQALRERLSSARRAFQDAMTANPIDEGAIRQRSADLAAVQADVAVARAHGRADMLQVLTPEQQAQMKALQDRLRDRLQTRRKRRYPL